MKKLYEELSDFLLQKVQEHSLNLTNRSQQLPREDQVFTVSNFPVCKYTVQLLSFLNKCLRKQCRDMGTSPYFSSIFAKGQICGLAFTLYRLKTKKRNLCS